MIKTSFTFIFGLLPKSRLKNILLRSCGHSVHITSQISPIILSKVSLLVLGRGSVLQAGSFFRNLRMLEIGENGLVGKFNHVYADLGFSTSELAGKLILAPGSYITNRHELDCSGGICLERFSAIAGTRTILQTHSVDFDLNAQTNAPIRIGSYSFIATNCLILMGVSFPSKSILGAGSLLPSHFSEKREGIFIGRPAKRLKDADGKWFSRENPHTIEYR
jgi:acetyltransferase-like isoleucine patch superfamily enzyme